MIRKLIGFILSVIVAVILFILLLQIFPSREKTVNVINMSYIFVDTDGTEYDVFKPVHGAPIDWSFLFGKNDDEEDESLQKDNVLGDKDYVGESDGKLDNENGIDGDMHNVNPNNPYNLPEGAIEKPAPKDCETPRGIAIKDNESILAYQQRSDVPDICNVQRRTCKNGVLDGSYTQPSCNENVVYVSNSKSTSSSKTSSSEGGNVVSYTKKTVVSHNDVPKGDLVQTPKYAKNEGAEFDKYGKLKYGEKDPITEWDNYDREGMIGNYDSKEQVNIKHYNCQTPWGEVVQHGQFVRAYELPYGFTNSTCKVELRLCVDGELKGSYAYQECDYLDVTYEEYNNLAELNEDQRITPEDHGFWAWLRNLFR